MNGSINGEVPVAPAPRGRVLLPPFPTRELPKQSETGSAALSDDGIMRMMLQRVFAASAHGAACNEVGSCFRVKQRVSDFRPFHVQMLIVAAAAPRPR